MNLSEAIRLGSIVRPRQIFMRLLEGDDGACAWGAAHEGAGMVQPGNYTNHYEIIVAMGWAVLAKTYVECPACHHDHTLQDTIVELNNVYRWSRERIADWVELQEPIGSHEPKEHAWAGSPTCVGQEVQAHPDEIPEPIPDPEEAPLEVAKC